MTEDSKHGAPDSPPAAQAPPTPRRGAIFAWMQLLRVPNLFTVPGDPLAGYLLALFVIERSPAFLHPLQPSRSYVAALAVAAASLFLYGAGLVHNDLCDLAEDSVERPTRPLPSGRITLRAARTVWTVLLLLGLGFAAAASAASLAVAVILVATIWIYNRYAKRAAVAGPLLMGLCRGLSLLMGALAVTSDAWQEALVPFHSIMEYPSVLRWACELTLHVAVQPLVVAAITGITLYIAAVTQIARGETRARFLGPLSFLPAAILAVWFLVTIALASPSAVEGMPIFDALAALAACWATYCGLLLGGTPQPRRVQEVVGMLIRGLLLIQATLIAILPGLGWFIAIELLLCWPLAGLVGKRFYGS